MRTRRKIKDYFVYEFPDISSAFAAVSTRSYRIRSGTDDREFNCFLQELELPHIWTVRLGQVHSNNIKIVTETPSPPDSIIELQEHDGVITQQPNIALTVATADCVPVLLYSSTYHLIGVIHAGWRGLYKNIVRNFFIRLKELKIPPADCEVILGPSISKPHYEVGKEFKQHFPGFVEEKGDKAYLGLKDVLIFQLKKEGLRTENIYDTGWCTYDRNDLFFSYRKEKTEFRNISLIALDRKQRAGKTGEKQPVADNR